MTRSITSISIDILAFGPQSESCRYQGAEGIHGLTTVVSRKDDCLVCGLSEVTVDIDPVSPLALLPEKL